MKLFSFEHPQQKIAFKGLICFFGLMLLFTMLSRGADSLTVAKVEVDTSKSGLIKQESSINGKVEALGDESPSVMPNLKVLEIFCKEGQEVEKGIPLMQFDSEEIKSLYEKVKNELEVIRLRLTSAELGGSLDTGADLLIAKRGVDNAKEDYKNTETEGDLAIERNQEDLDSAQADYEKVRADYDKLNSELYKDKVEKAQKAYEDAKKERDKGLTSFDSSYVSAERALEDAETEFKDSGDKYKEARAELERAEASGDEAAIEAARTKLAAAESAYDSADMRKKRAKEDLEEVESKYSNSKSDSDKKVQESKKILDDLMNDKNVDKDGEIIAAKNAMESAEKNIKTLERSGEDALRNKEKQLTTAKRTVDNANFQLELAEQKVQSEAGNREAESSKKEIEVRTIELELNEKEKELAKLGAILSADCKLTAPVSGRIVSLGVKKNEKTTDSPPVTIARSDEGFLFKGFISEKQLEDWEVGDPISVETEDARGNKNYAETVIDFIGTPDSEGKIEVSAALSGGNYKVGASGTAGSNKERKEYQLCVPVGALREDSSGKFVYVVREKESILGNVLTAEQVPVEVVARDSKIAAIEGAIQGDDKIITGSNKDLVKGDRVRILAE